MGKKPCLHITWQRLVDDFSATCPRCNDTEQNLDTAVDILHPVLVQKGIHILVQKKRILPMGFNQNPLDSNRIFIEGKPLETWLNAETGKSPCCDACGDNECRTLIYEGTTYEEVPRELIIRGILRAVEAIFNINTNDKDMFVNIGDPGNMNL
ncbi:MAG: DUF2703 domain-containing protein [Syntrophaceae bacterium]|nr:DUF2703 domain-containing protein [Syntrophaceae bacterium]